MSASADNLATSDGAAQAPPTAARLSSVARGATEEPFLDVDGYPMIPELA